MYNYNDKYMRYFVRQMIKRGRVSAFNHYCKRKLVMMFEKSYQKNYMLQELFMML